MHAKLRDFHQNDKSIWVPALISVVLCMQNSDFWARLISLYGSLTSSMVLSTHNSVLSTRVSRLYGFQPSPVVLCLQNSDFRARITILCGSQTPPVVYPCNTAALGLKLQVFVGPSPHLCFFHVKQRLLDKNNKSLWVPDMTCRFVYVQQRA